LMDKRVVTQPQGNANEGFFCKLYWIAFFVDLRDQ
jgi:hypothetical protein